MAVAKQNTSDRGGHGQIASYAMHLRYGGGGGSHGQIAPCPMQLSQIYS